MKDIKSYVIGFLSCACLFLIMGQIKNTATGNMWVDPEETTEWNVDGKVIVEASKHGRYQAISANKYESFYLLDTGTGAVYTQIENPNKNTYKKRLADVWSRSPYVYEFINSITP